MSARFRPPTHWRWALVAVASAVVFVVSVIERDAPTAAGPWWDTQLHVVGYFGYGLAIAVAAIGVRDRARRLAFVGCGAFAYGGLMECVQILVPYRAFSSGDIVANGVGATLAVGVLDVWSRAGDRDHTESTR